MFRVLLLLICYLFLCLLELNYGWKLYNLRVHFLKRMPTNMDMGRVRDEREGAYSYTLYMVDVMCHSEGQKKKTFMVYVNYFD